MTDAELQILATELDLPAYASMTDQQAADSLNTANKSVSVPFISGVDFGNYLVLSEFNALTAEQRNTIRSMFGIQFIPTQSGFFRDFILATFAAGTATRVALIAAFTKLVTRAQELGITEKVGAHHVNAARLI